MSSLRLATKEWLEQYIPQTDWQTNLNIIDKSSTLSGDEFKVSRLQKNQISCMVEDNPTTVASINAHLPQCRVFYVNQPWNSSDHDPVRATLRVNFDDPEAIYQRILSAREEYYSC